MGFKFWGSDDDEDLAEIEIYEAGEEMEVEEEEKEEEEKEGEIRREEGIVESKVERLAETGNQQQTMPEEGEHQEERVGAEQITERVVAEGATAEIEEEVGEREEPRAEEQPRSPVIVGTSMSQTSQKWLTSRYLLQMSLYDKVPPLRNQPRDESDSGTPQHENDIISSGNGR